MHVLIAPNAFKNSLTASEAARAVRQGLEESKLTFTSECFPVGDGGDGTGDLLIERLKGEKIESMARGPFGKKIKTYWGLGEEGRTAIIEMANASGLRLLDKDELNPMRALSQGTGDLVRAALDRGVRRILIGMGGSATVDGGTGILQALGFRFLDREGKDLFNLPEDLVHLETIDGTGVDPRLAGGWLTGNAEAGSAKVELTVLCDVDNRLLGPSGSAAVFGPQKGASTEDVGRLEAGLRRLSEVVYRQTGKDLATLTYGGTAGGAAAGLWGLLGANLVNGIEFFLDSTGFDKALQSAHWVITGEGSIDEQTLQGKGPFGVAVRARRLNIPVIGLAGKVPLEKSHGLQEYFDVLLAIGNGPMDLPAALKYTAANLTRTATEIGNLLARE